ncbi:pantothenate transporter [Colletotrichum costaricense]|uniref:Pantothenate transporter n=1 Tax=Colletotrichum costaricense TaxID=1209916 RepID=A0AAI9YMV7_9PEZI|nr:pantothenate transporter [Colletotrichum costaricense]KAK1516865.1 pantothenate transporter [Colletotrichum costaricense]
MTSDGRKQDFEVSTGPEVQLASSEVGRWRVLSHVSRKVWGDDPRERKYVRKLDTFLFSYVLLGYFIKYLDQNNYSNAFVSGMQEELDLYGNERNLLNTYFNIGIILGTIPAQMIQLKYVRPSIWIPACELGWSALTMIMASAKNVETLYALRFFIGLLESCSFPGFASILGSWYGKSQLAKRMALFEQTAAIAGMFSGYLQAGLYTGMNGTAGLSGWRWLFIMDGVISIPIALYGFFALPDLPHNTRAFYLQKEDREYGMERIKAMGRKPPSKLTLKAIKEIYTSWQLWAFILPYLMVAEAGSGTGYFNLFLKSEGYSVVKTNILPTIGNAIQIVAAFGMGWLSDATGSRVLTVMFVQAMVLVSNIILSIWNVPKAALFAAFYLSYTGGAAQPIVISYGHEITQSNANLRQLLVATGNIFTYTFSAWMPVVLFPTYDAPKYKYGYQILILFGGLAVAGMYLLDFLYKRDLKRNPQLYEVEQQSDNDHLTSERRRDDSLRPSRNDFESRYGTVGHVETSLRAK